MHINIYDELLTRCGNSVYSSIWWPVATNVRDKIPSEMWDFYKTTIIRDGTTGSLSREVDNEVGNYEY